MNCGKPLRDTDTRGRAWRALLAPLALVLIAASSGGAIAASFYKWTDAQGQVHYGDAPPKGFTGEVTRVEVDPADLVATPPKARASEERATMGLPPPGPGILERRRATRATLEANLEAARARLDAAKAALAEGADQGTGQVIQQTFDPTAPPTGTPPSNGTPGSTGSASMGGMLGMSTSRQNCHVNANKTVTCAAVVGNAEAAQHLAALEEAVKRAEAEVADAEVAYRKGVD